MTINTPVDAKIRAITMEIKTHFPDASPDVQLQSMAQILIAAMGTDALICKPSSLELFDECEARIEDIRDGFRKRVNEI